MLVSVAAPVAAQTPDQLRTFHDQAAGLIARMAARPLTEGDTFLTFNPEPGGLVHTTRVTAGGVESSLLRGDRMEGTARVDWLQGRVTDFDILWTRADTLRGPKIDSAVAVRGRIVGDSIVVTAPAQRALATPSLPWAVADIGMEELLIPLLRSLQPGSLPQQVAVLRPYHLRWDTVTVTVRDTAGLRVADARHGGDHEIWVLTGSGQLLCVHRVDHPGDRLPLPNSDRYVELQANLATVRAIFAPFPVEQQWPR
jgi:hypothetical protein